ncbi:MAG: hypothetical protein EPO24_05060 [Bacteroidetes bacterium]|nr:MAG: hypothetical protein EPO24_05060 [Bacteroidota bacterium]
MAGIIGFFSSALPTYPLRDVLSRTLSPSQQLPHVTTVMAEGEHPRVAMGGVFPNHFQRNAVVTSHEIGTLLFYGELYNELGLIDEAEFVLQHLNRNGIAGISGLNGPFAFLFWNKKEQTLITATDRLGRFPLFYFQLNDSVCVTSDLHLVFASGIYTPALNEESIIDFLTIGFPLGEQSMFEGINRISAGEYLVCSGDRIDKKRYWQPEYTNSLSNTEPMVESFISCNERAMKKRPGSIVALSGGWDSRATVAALSHHSKAFPVMTFGEENSTDVVLASTICKRLQLHHNIISADSSFFDMFEQLANDVVTLGNGHATVDLAFQLFAFRNLAGKYAMLLDSAGCEFRRGIRSKIAAQRATSTSDISDFLLSMYATGVWNNNIIAKDFFHHHAEATRDRLTEWLESRSLPSYEDQIDAFSWYELWSHHYAHGYPLQTNVIACHMPYSDNEFYDLFLQADRSIRWSHKFHRATIRALQPSLERIPISYGHVKVPYGENLFRYAPMAYHTLNSALANIPALKWIKEFDNWKPFRPYHTWYGKQLFNYTREILNSAPIISSGYLNMDAVNTLLNNQQSTSQDFSHNISILLTLTHVLQYCNKLTVNK